MTSGGRLFRERLPRVFELRDTLSDPLLADAYFQDFESSLKTNQLKLDGFEKIERQLDALDDRGWRDLRERAAPQLRQRDEARGWQALFDTLSEAKAFGYLQKRGCTDVRFIPRPQDSKKMEKTPDLKGLLDGCTVLCEVKTINISKDEAERRKAMYEGTIAANEANTSVVGEFLAKLRSTLENAVKQLDAQDPKREARRIVFAVIHFDDWVGDCQAEYLAQIDEALVKNPVVGAELVFSPACNLFGRPLAMKSATVFEFE